jgi:serine-type anaerobic sulfatase-maturating enzyme
MTVAGQDSRGALLPPGVPRQFHLLAKPTGAVCNLHCTYCFFLSKEMLYPGSRFRMADDLLELCLRQLIEAHKGAPEVVVAWQGGEPTMMGLDFFRRSVELAQQYRQPSQQITYTIQTNGTLLDDDWAAFFRQYGFLVGLSIDGPAEIHDTYRVDKGGKGSFGRVMNGLAALQRHGVEWNALTTVHAANQHLGREVYAFLRDACGARFMQFIPIVERATPQTLAIADAGQAGHPASLLPQVRGAVRLPRRLPQGPLRHHPRRGAWPALSVPGLQGVLRSHPAGYGRHVRAAAR